MRVPILLLLTSILVVPVSASNRMLTTEFEVNAPIEKARRAWTTSDGIGTFFAPECKVELREDGAYEIYFLPQAKWGERGSEGMRILALEPMQRFAFTWGAPPTIPYVRSQRSTALSLSNGSWSGRLGQTTQAAAGCTHV